MVRRTALVLACSSVLPVLATGPALAGGGPPAEVVLTVTRGPGSGQVQLDWSGGAGAYGVFRATSPIAVLDGSNRQGQTGANRWIDSPPAGPIDFYLVANPSCSTGADCPSGFCVDGACCNSDCSGFCQACNVAASVGTCAPIPEDADPNNECAVVCATLPPLASGTCEVTAGGPETLLIGTVLGAPDVYVGGEVLIDAAGMIACVGCGCAASAPLATVVRCPTGVIAPGLINTLDFLSYAQNRPFSDTGERWEHRHEWRLGLNGHTKINVAGNASTDQMRWGEMRQLLGGATSIVGSGSSAGLLRNLNVASRQEGLNQSAVLADTFPLGDSNGTLLSSGCAYPSIRNESDIAGLDAYNATVAEGLLPEARNEFVCLSSSANGGQDLVQPQSSFRHAIGVTAADLAAMATDGTGLIWSPRSNIALYGDTTRITAAARLGVAIALATDWIVSGSMSLRRELRCADEFDTTYLGNFFSDSDLVRMVTGNAAAITGTDDVVGSLATGKFADIAVFDAASAPKYRAVVAAEPPEVVLVLRGGTALYGDAAVVEAIRGPGCDPLDVCGRAKQVCLQSEIGKTLAQLQAGLGNVYPAFFCGTPIDEPTCRPARSVSVAGSSVYTGWPTPEDPDGDGIAAGDNCPSVFNPVRPLDGGVQADADGDGQGDACDACPTQVSCP